MKKPSTFQILNFVFWAVLVLINMFFLKPIIKSKYLDVDVRAFKEVSWKYSIIVFVIILFAFVGYNYKVNKEKLKIKGAGLLVIRGFGLLIFFALFLSFILKNITDDFLLFINTKIDCKNTIIAYKVIENKENGVYELYDNKNYISDEDELSKINKNRIGNKSKSILEYKNNDIIHVEFNKGLLGVNFIK